MSIDFSSLGNTIPGTGEPGLVVNKLDFVKKRRGPYPVPVPSIEGPAVRGRHSPVATYEPGLVANKLDFSNGRRYPYTVPSVEGLAAQGIHSPVDTYEPIVVNNPVDTYEPIVVNNPVDTYESAVSSKPIDTPPIKQVPSEDVYLNGLIKRFGSIGNAIASNPKLVNANNPKVRGMLATEATAIQQQQQQVKPVTTSNELGFTPAPIASIPAERMPIQESDGLARFGVEQARDMSRAADINKMRTNKSYADAVANLFGY